MNATQDLVADTPLRVPDHVLSRRAAAETVVLNLDNERYYGLAGVGSHLWDLVEAGTTFGKLVATLEAEYDVDHDVLVADLTALVNDLRRNGLISSDAA